MIQNFFYIYKIFEVIFITVSWNTGIGILSENATSFISQELDF